jgi:chemotaxis signal transduction protein
MPPAPTRTTLCFRLGQEHCHLDIAQVERVVPWALLEPPPPGAVPAFAGWLRLAGTFLPVVDLNQWVLQQPAPAVYSSRIMVLKPDASRPRLGLLVEQLTDTQTARGESSGRLLDPARILAPLLPLLPATAPA